MWCLRARRLMSAFVDREVDAGTGSSISSHLRWCWWCRKEAEKIASGASLAREAREVEIPAADKSMLAAIQSTERVPDSPAAKSLPWSWAAATAASVLLLLTLLSNPLRQYFWPFGQNSKVYALDFGFEPPGENEDLLKRFRERFGGKFREFPFNGRPDAKWAPYAFKFPKQLPPEVSIKSVVVFDPQYCGSIGFIFSEGARNLYIGQQPADRPIDTSKLKMTTDQFCKYKTDQCPIGSYRFMTWTADNLRMVVLGNLKNDKIEATVNSLEFVQ